jgi:hypothetical protein
VLQALLAQQDLSVLHLQLLAQQVRQVQQAQQAHKVFKV